MTLYEMQGFKQIQELFINCETGEVMGDFTHDFLEFCDYWKNGKDFMHMEFCRLEVTLQMKTAGLFTGITLRSRNEQP